MRHRDHYCGDHKDAERLCNTTHVATIDAMSRSDTHATRHMLTVRRIGIDQLQADRQVTRRTVAVSRIQQRSRGRLCSITAVASQFLLHLYLQTLTFTARCLGIEPSRILDTVTDNLQQTHRCTAADRPADTSIQ